MSFLAASETDSRQIEQQALITPGDPEAFKPDLFEGSGTAAAVGVGRVAGIFNQFAGEAEYRVASAITRPIDELFDTELTGFLDEKLRKAPAELTASMTPDPYTTGSVGKVLYGLVGIGVPAAIGGAVAGPPGAAAMTFATQTLGTTTDLKAQGVDEATATGAGLIEGATTAAGVLMPASIGGKVALNTLLYGPAANVAQDVIASKSIGWFLGQQGYDELSDRYSEIQSESIVADIVLGAAFGYMGARGVPREAIHTADIDAANVAMDRKHIEVDTAPGVPADLQAVQTHTARMEKATEQLLAGEPVNVDDVGKGGEFVARPEFGPGDEAIISALKEYGYPGALDEVSALETELLQRGRTLEEPEAIGDADYGAADAVALRPLEAAPADNNVEVNLSDKLPDGSPRYVQRIEESRNSLPTGDKDHGIYTSPADVESPHSDLGGERGMWEISEDANVLTLKPFGREVVMRRDAVSAGAGVHMARHFLGAERFAALLELSKNDLVSWASEHYPNVDFARYFDRQEVMEAIGAQEARRAGHDVVYMPDKDPQWSEVVVLNYNKIKRIEDNTPDQDATAPRPDMEIATPDGPVRTADAIERVDAGVKAANEDAPGFMAAVNCFLRVGT